MTGTTLNRLGSANNYDNTIGILERRQASLSNLQDHISAGKKVLRPSDDPTAAAQAERAMTRINRIAADQRALAAQRNSIAMAESTLGNVSSALQNFRELVVAAGNGSYAASDRQTIASQLTQLRDQIFSLANTQDTNGQPLFGALGSALAPFVGPNTPPQDYTFNGLPGQASSSEVSIPFALDGDSAFMFHPARDGVYNVTVTPASSTLQTDTAVVTDATLVTGSSYTISSISVGSGVGAGTNKATYDVQETKPDGTVSTVTGQSGPDFSPISKTIPVTVGGLALNLTGAPTAGDSVTITPNASIFSALDNAIAGIGNAANSSAASQAVSQALRNIDIGMGRVSAVRGQAGALLNRADTISANQDSRNIQLEADRSKAEDIDMIQSISDMQNQQTGYQAALQTYAQVQKLSLFNYIG